MINIDWRFSQAELKQAAGSDAPVGRQRLRRDRMGAAAPQRRGPHTIGGGDERAAHDARDARSGLRSRCLGARARDRRLGRRDRRRRPRRRCRRRRETRRRDRTDPRPLRRALLGRARVVGSGARESLRRARASSRAAATPTVTPDDVTTLAKQGEPLARKAQGDVLRVARHRGGRSRAHDGRARRRVHRGRHRAAARRALAKSEFRARFEAKAVIATTSAQFRPT